MSIISDAVTTIGAKLTALGVTWAHDPGQARPKCVMVELPELDVATRKVADVTVRLIICSAPPGNSTSNKWIATTADTIIDSDIAIVSARPSWIEYGGQQMPTYELTARLGHHIN